MKHFFLTGEIQIGKSTVIRKTLADLNVNYGGFRTCFSHDRLAADRGLYISRAETEPLYDEAHRVARFCPGEQAPQVFTECFDTLGAEYILHAANGAPLLVMDELGDMERDAGRFQAAVLAALEGKTPILGVIKLSAVGWVNQIREHPNVELLTVNADNRDCRSSCPARCKRIFRRCGSLKKDCERAWREFPWSKY